ncbi:MAG: ribonuclease Z [Cytophagales bacterium]|nr:ribonuclease Z [Cytophagales bacterium]
MAKVAQMQMMRYQVPIHKIEQIFISHLHGDHYLGLMGLLFSMHLQRRISELHLHSEQGLDEIVLQLKYSKSALNFQIKFHSFDPQTSTLLYSDDALTVETIPLIHKLPCAGFLFKEKRKPVKVNKEKLKPGMLLQHIAQLKKGEDVVDENGKLLYRNTDYTLPPLPSYSFAFCSDTAWNEKMIEQIRAVKLLYHEATFMEDEKDKAHETKHSTARDAATMAKQVGAEKLLVGHFSARYQNLEPLLQEAKQVFPNTELAIEGATFELPYDTNPGPEEK